MMEVRKYCRLAYEQNLDCAKDVCCAFCEKKPECTAACFFYVDDPENCPNAMDVPSCKYCEHLRAFMYENAGEPGWHSGYCCDVWNNEKGNWQVYQISRDPESEMCEMWEQRKVVRNFHANH